MQNQNKRHHPLDLNTLKGHGDSVTGLCFSSDGRSLATACGDGVIRVFKLGDASSKSVKFLRINLPAGGHPTAVAFADDASSFVVACHTVSGSSLYMYGEENQKEHQAKLPLPGIKWERHNIHEREQSLPFLEQLQPTVLLMEVLSLPLVQKGLISYFGMGKLGGIWNMLIQTS